MGDSKTDEAYPPPQQGYPPQQQGYPAQYPPPPAYESEKAYQPPGQPQQGYPAQLMAPTNQYPGASGQYNAQAPPPGNVVIVRAGQGQPNDHLLFSIMVTLFCCFPCGIVAIIKSTNVRSRYSAGDVTGAQESANSAKNWAMAGLISGIVWSVLWITFLIIYYTVLWGVIYGHHDTYNYNG